MCKIFGQGDDVWRQGASFEDLGIPLPGVPSEGAGIKGKRSPESPQNNRTPSCSAWDSLPDTAKEHEGTSPLPGRRRRSVLWGNRFRGSLPRAMCHIPLIDAELILFSR